MNVASNEELMADLNSRVTIAVDNVATALNEKLHSIIEKNVYDAYFPMNYERTREFKDSFIATKAMIKDFVIQATIEQDVTIMIIRGQTHANRDYLAKMIELGEGFWNPNVPARPFWKEFEEYANANVYSLLKEELRKQGIQGV